MSDMRVVIIEGHFPGPDKLRSPISTSTLEAVLELNDFTPEEKADIRTTMRREGFFQFGGGAEAETTMYQEDAWRALVDTIAENHPGTL